jgi:3-hydroxyisobutyrate dehydrogenase-like beta-hydroxyacid dehydrogenase
MSRRTKKNVGIIGLGIIGSRVREVLRRKGFHVFVWNRTPLPVPNFVGAPAELAEMCDYIELFVSDDDALLEVIKQLSPGLTARHVIIAHSTVAPHTMLAAAEAVQTRGARFVEAPFTGSKEAAENGQLVYYIGADEAALNEVRPVLEASSKEVMLIGEVGQATVVKITTNMVTAASVQAVAEALALVQTAGLPLEKFAAAMKGNASNSKTLDLKLPKMLSGDYEPHFSVKHMLKDMQIASRMGLSHHLELGVTSAARDRLLEQLQRGYGDEDYSAVARKYFGELAKEAREADLELFGPRPSPPPEPEWIEISNSESTKPAPVEVVEKSEVAPTETTEKLETPIVVPAEIEEVPVDDKTQPMVAAAPPDEPVAAVAPSDDAAAVVEKEEPDRRGFFGRLLRRESQG